MHSLPRSKTECCHPILTTLIRLLLFITLFYLINFEYKLFQYLSNLHVSPLLRQGNTKLGPDLLEWIYFFVLWKVCIPSLIVWTNNLMNFCKGCYTVFQFPSLPLPYLKGLEEALGWKSRLIIGSSVQYNIRWSLEYLGPQLGRKGQQISNNNPEWPWYTWSRATFLSRWAWICPAPVIMWAGKCSLWCQDYS